VVDPVRNSDIAVTLTGVLIAGVAYFWRALPGFFSLSRNSASGSPARASPSAGHPRAA
jgi:hypothetical protein